MADLEITATLDRLTDAVQARLPGVLYDIVRGTLWDTIEDFCARTSYWSRVVPFGPGTSPVTIEPPTGAKIYRVVEAYGVAAYNLIQPDQIDSYTPGDATGTALVVLCPADLNSTPAFLLRTWFEAFYEGTLFRLYAEPEKPYSNKDFADFFAKRLEGFIDAAGKQALRSADIATVGQGSLVRIYSALNAAVSGVSHAELQQAVWSTVQDFLTRSTWWTETVAWLPTPSPITVAAPAGTRVQRIVEVYDLSAYSVTQPDRIAVFDNDTTGRALVALIPLTLDVVPDVVLATWFEAVFEGSLARLHAGAGRPQGSAELVKYYSDRYEKLVEQAGRQATRFVTDRPTRSADIDRLYMALRSNLDIDTPQTVIRQMAWNTIEDFYIQSLVCREHVYWKMAPGARTIDFNPFDETKLVAWILNWRGLTRGKVEHPSVLRDLAFPVSTQERQGEAWLALKPVNLAAVECCACGDLWSTWFEYVLSGCLYRLYLQPGRPYSNPKLADYHYKRYRAGVASARDTSGRGYSAGSPVRGPYFARGRQY